MLTFTHLVAEALKMPFYQSHRLGMILPSVHCAPPVELQEHMFVLLALLNIPPWIGVFLISVPTLALRLTQLAFFTSPHHPLGANIRMRSTAHHKTTIAHTIDGL